MTSETTIFAVSTARGRAGVAVIRLSGPASCAALEALAGPLPAERRAALRRLAGPGGDVIDEGLVIWFGEGRSFTGELSAELQVHGSAAVVAALLQALGRMPGLRPAEAGEFTRRAVENGRMDLTAAEGLGDLITAETEAQRRAARRLVEGDLARAAATWREGLVRALALLTAMIDFADEDLPETGAEALRLIGQIRDSLARELTGFVQRSRLRSGFEVAIIGRPNVGKSTLLNALAGRDMALTSPEAGTTRDVLELWLDLGGLPVTFLDTAGLRDEAKGVEAAGVARARTRAAEADLRVVLAEKGARGLPADVVLQDGDLVLRAKADSWHGDDLPGVSGLTGAGIAEMLDRITATLSERLGDGGLIAQERHRRAVAEGLERLDSALSLAATAGPGDERVAEDLAAAVRALDALVGRVDVESVLGEIFSRFCIGK